MIPYDTFLYFLFLLGPLALLVLLGLAGRLGAKTVLVIGMAALVFQYANPLGQPADIVAGLRQLAFFGAFVVGSTVLVVGFGFLRQRQRSRIAFWGALAIALLPLIVLKVQPLVAGLARPAADATGVAATSSLTGVEAFGFLGMSYITFRVIDAIILLEDGVVKVVDPLDFVTYVSFWPTISAGPIDRFRRFHAELQKSPPIRHAYVDDVETGLHRIAQGFLYKFIFAVLVFRYALDPASKAPGLLGLAEYTYAYSLYLFFDFAGYSAFAIGLGRFCGIHVPENFNRPWLARDFKDMWNRWHISLSWFFRDHIYMRFLLKAGRSKWFGGDRYVASYVGQLITMTLMGAWHGLTPHYLTYGLYQAAMLVLSDLIGRWNHQGRIIPDTWLSRVGSVFVTVNLFCFGLLIFSGHLFW